MIQIRPEQDLNKQSAQTIRQPSTALFTVSSKDRFNNYLERRSTENEPKTNPYDFLIYKNQALFNGFFTRIGLTEVVFPWTIPNINSKTRNILISVNAGPPIQISLTQGFYTPSELAQALENEIQPHCPGFQMSYGSNSSWPPGPTYTAPAFYYYAGVGNDISFFAMPYNSSSYPYTNNVKQLFDLLGFSEENAFPSLIGNGATTFATYTEYIDVVCNQITYNQALKDGTSSKVSRDSIARIYIQSEGTSAFIQPFNANFIPAGCSPFTIYRQFTNPKQIQWSPNQPLGQIQIQIYDDQGELLQQELPSNIGIDGPGTDFNLTFLVSEN